MCYVAQGSADAYLEFGIHCWDIAAALVIVQEAGGFVCDITALYNTEKQEKMKSQKTAHYSALPIKEWQMNESVLHSPSTRKLRERGF
ncbi:unnamed protein product [Soboliphyme baturini]|uniref:Inositol monophosphatase n=1 Tax=Soboliphyme baturini TaxID=241478 RepID=A0A183IX04_9BILA|nr:unnamed protein product [Soboliphyme baturini]